MLYMGQHVNATTNIARRKTGLKGKQQFAVRLLDQATVFTDEVAQSINTGKAQNAFGEKLFKDDDII